MTNCFYKNSYWTSSTLKLGWTSLWTNCCYCCYK